MFAKLCFLFGKEGRVRMESVPFLCWFTQQKVATAISSVSQSQELSPAPHMVARAQAPGPPPAAHPGTVAGSWTGSGAAGI